MPKGRGPLTLGSYPVRQSKGNTGTVSRTRNTLKATMSKGSRVRGRGQDTKGVAVNTSRTVRDSG